MTLNLLRGLGWTVPAAVLVPNALWAALPGAATPAPPAAAPASWVRWVVPVEWVGRVAVFVLPAFYRFSLGTVGGRLALGVMLLALAFYYTGWARCFTRGRNPVLLYKPLFGVPLPLAVSPVVYFLAASVALRSMPLAVGAVVFGSAHIAISAFNYERLLVGSRASST
jgi:hypothetical protein